MWMFLRRSAAGVLVVREQRYWCIQYCVTDRTRFVCDEWLCQQSWRLCCSIHIDTNRLPPWHTDGFCPRSFPYRLISATVLWVSLEMGRSDPASSRWVSREFINTHNSPVDLSLWDLGGVTILFPVDRNVVVAKLAVGLVFSLQDNEASLFRGVKQKSLQMPQKAALIWPFFFSIS